MELIAACSLALLEMTFIFVALLLFHALRKIIGVAAFYIAIGLLLVFTQIVSSAELQVVLGLQGADFYVANTVLFLPYLTALMIIYITEGTLATQRLIIGAMATLGFFIYLSHITSTQCNWLGHSISQGPTADSMEYLLRQSRRTMAGSTLAQALDLFLIPIFFQRLRNLKCRIFICVLGSLMLTQIVDTFVFVTATYWGEPQWWLYIHSSYFAKAVATVWLSMLATIYISRVEMEVPPGQGRGTLDIVFAFFGGYGKARELEQNLREWEGRYKLVVENASEMILLLNSEGKILDANFAAVRILHVRSRKKLIGRAFSEMVFDKNDKPVNWDDYCESFQIEDTSEGPHIQRLQCLAKINENEKLEIDIAISSIEVDEVPMMIVLGRDVTEENRLAREKEELSIRLAHTQRLESIGELAGGVAHDFNNYIHAIQGHLDVITYMHEVKDEKIVEHLEKINDITEKAAHLTQQLLGFARKGKYIRKTINLNELIKESVELFMPRSLEGMDFNLDITGGDPMWIKGDPVQLQQVFLNLLINARDAVEENDGRGKRISMSAKEAILFNIKIKPNVELKNVNLSDFYCVEIKDNGCGVKQEDLERIFEPFYTTKPFGKGTGMGLAMVYGTVSNHGGWVQVSSQQEKGASFYVFLPRC